MKVLCNNGCRWRKFSYTASNDQSGILYPYEPDLFKALNTRVKTVSFARNFFSNIQINFEFVPALPHCYFLGDVSPILWDLLIIINML